MDQTDHIHIHFISGTVWSLESGHIYLPLTLLMLNELSKKIAFKEHLSALLVNVSDGENTEKEKIC